MAPRLPTTWLTPSLPLTTNTLTGYELINEYQKLVKQNFKLLLHTIPGERMMNPDFGVGIQRFLFELDTPMLYDRISTRIKEQVDRWMSYMQIEDIYYKSAAIDEDMDPQVLNVVIVYKIVPLNLVDQIIIPDDTETLTLPGAPIFGSPI